MSRAMENANDVERDEGEGSPVTDQCRPTGVENARAEVLVLLNDETLGLSHEARDLYMRGVPGLGYEDARHVAAELRHASALRAEAQVSESRGLRIISDNLVPTSQG